MHTDIVCFMFSFDSNFLPFYSVNHWKNFLYKSHLLCVSSLNCLAYDRFNGTAAFSQIEQSQWFAQKIESMQKCLQSSQISLGSKPTNRFLFDLSRFKSFVYFSAFRTVFLILCAHQIQFKFNFRAWEMSGLRFAWCLHVRPINAAISNRNLISRTV